MATTKAPAFFSYSRKNSAVAKRLAADLKRAGANVWLDQLDIRPGRQWDREVEQALNACREMIVILSPDAVDSDNVMDEIAYALKERKAVIPLLLQDCQIPFRLSRIQYIDFRSDYDDGLRHLLSSLATESQLESSVEANQVEGSTRTLRSFSDSGTLTPLKPVAAEQPLQAPEGRIEREKAEAVRKTEQDYVERASLLAFLSYVQSDDGDGHVTKFWEGLRSAMPQDTSAKIFFQDPTHIQWGEDWRKHIRESLSRTLFLIPILTPDFFQSNKCCDELKCFLEREYALRRQDLILPVYFCDCPEVNDQMTKTCDYLAAELAKHQYADWRKMNQKRYFTKEKVELKRLASMLWEAYLRPAPNLNELVVDQATGDYRSIQAAIRSTTEGTRIAVKEGIYREALMIDKPVEIVGVGERKKQ